MTSLVDKNVRCRVSSVLNRDAKQYGKQFLFDGSEETCWTSGQGESQFVVIEFGRDVSVREIRVMFQGGFACAELDILGALKDEAFEELGRFYPEDVNREQVFLFPNPTRAIDKLNVQFVKGTDFYGRITMYKLDIVGDAVR
eukprot:Opistho-2@54095